MSRFTPLSTSHRPSSKTKTISPEKNTHYDLYVYHATDHDKRLPRWEKVLVTQCIQRARQMARVMQRRHDYTKIEIKKRFFCRYKNKYIGKTIYLYQASKSSWSNMIFRLLSPYFGAT